MQNIAKSNVEYIMMVQRRPEIQKIERIIPFACYLYMKCIYNHYNIHNAVYPPFPYNYNEQ